MTKASPLVITPAEAIDLWSFEEIRIECDRPPDLEDYPDLALRVRGALGRALHDAPPPVAHRFDPFDRPRPYPAMFGELAPGVSEARPFVISAESRADIVAVEVRLFGRARIWTDSVTTALAACLRKGIALRGNGRHRIAFEPERIMTRRVYAQAPPRTASVVSLRFLTPVCIRQGQTAVVDRSAVIRAAISRLRDCGALFDCRVDADWSALHVAANALAVDDSGLTPILLSRYSQRQRDRRIEATGLLGHMTAVGDLTPLLPFLALAPYLHVGGHTALGFGCCEVALA